MNIAKSGIPEIKTTPPIGKTTPSIGKTTPSIGKKSGETDRHIFYIYKSIQKQRNGAGQKSAAVEERKRGELI